jgi:dTMP kinase
MFIVLEGIDGAGTTTQMGRLAASLRERGVPVHETSEPSPGPVGRLLREALRGRERIDPLTVALLFAADRIDHYEREIGPALGRGELVLCDRYLGSSLVYQGAFADLTWVREVNRHARRADLTLVVDVPAEEARKRRTARGGEPELFDGQELQARLAAAYRRLPELMPEERVVVVDGAATPEVVEARLLQAIRPLL